jgi:hypothetical protein
VRYESRKRLADTRPRIRGQFVKAEALLKMQQGEQQGEDEEEEEEEEDRMEAEGEEQQQDAPPAAQRLHQGGGVRQGQGRPQRHAQPLPPLPPTQQQQQRQQQQGRHRAAPSQQHLVGAKRRKSTPGRADY